VWGGGVPVPPPHWSRGLERGSPENFGTFSLEMAHFGANSVVYINRNARQFTARTTTVTVLLAAGGRGGSIEPVEPHSLRAWSAGLITTTRLSTVLAEDDENNGLECDGPSLTCKY